MAPSDSDDWIKTEESSSDFDDGLGDDWESAFQAEEFMFSPGEGGEDDFFLETSGPSTAYQFTPPQASDLSGLPDLDQDAGTVSASGEPPADAPGTDSRAGRRLGARFFNLPLIHRLALGGTTALLLLVALVLLRPWGRQPDPATGGPAVAPPATHTPLPAAAPADTIRRKWQFTPFVLPVAAAEPAEKPAFLEVDLALVLVLTGNDELPEDKKLFVRDLIYRYYRQQPLATLRRFALARAEMNRNLLAWLRRHWPEAPIETVVFSRYQLT